MPTFNDLVDEVKANLQGYTLRQDRITYVLNSTGLTTTTSQITVGSQSNLARGIIEIDDELIWIDSVDSDAMCTQFCGKQSHLMCLISLG